MKNLDDIWQEYIDQDCLSPHTLKELAWHIEYDPDPVDAITMATDMGLKQLAPCIAKHLDHDDDYVRELSVGCLLGRLKLPEYAEQGFKMAQEDPDSGVKGLAIFNIGEILNEIRDKNLRYKIALYLYQVLIGIKEQESSLKKGSSYQSILAAMGIPNLERPRVRDLGKDIDFDLVERFKKKYGIQE